MNKAATIIALILGLIITLLIYFDFDSKKNKNTFVFPNSIIVQNNTEYKSIDTLIMLSANKLFNYDTINIKVYYMQTSIVTTEDFIVYAYIQKDPNIDHSYILFLNRDISVSVEKIIAHEMVHLKQLEDGDLVQNSLGHVIYKGDSINLYKIKYNNRPYEIEAFKNESIIKNKLNHLLYKNK